MKRKVAILISILLVLILGIFLIIITYQRYQNRIIPEDQKTFCTNESRNAQACIQIYQPVCGWYDSEKVNCIKYPCAETFSNSCQACLNENVEFYTEGVCPN